MPQSLSLEITKSPVIFRSFPLNPVGLPLSLLCLVARNTNMRQTPVVLASTIIGSSGTKACMNVNHMTGL
ncbi:hypothetical protein TNCV_4986911 [Trichonephila clavipes]|nr:hypothetical protein TNCV_4986911 [Trichonephila clavipes]